ncbi:isochorismate synthase [filamentous cyanobacterium LEGE 11480]|uniref:isochorismate synthase n=1 Tax=Romeriopsis navalis LEGE 11480 TaxID=2777977 RepID=A0A928VIW8_9CYAN|nr:isochorismate synthase [Romeriopsis navalis]MBE9029436.1 isochorismate synthase [Romeriopsis navalis LEGE 11480]
MSVIEKPFFALESAYQLSDFLTECYLAFRNNRHPRLVSIKFPIASFNPLAILQRFHGAQHHHFYFEHADDCFVGLGKAIQLTVESRDRFAQTRDLITDLSSQILSVDAAGTVQAITDSRFFCNFSFFAQGQTDTSQAAILLPRWQVEQKTSSDQPAAWAIVNIVLHPDFIPEAESQRISQELENLRSAKSVLTKPVNAITATIAPQSTSTQVQFKQSVTNALKSISNGQLDKIVLAKTLDIHASEPFDLISSLQNLRDHYPSCYIFSATCGAGKTFIGASPERLVAVQDQQLKTEALAGSAPRGKTTQADQKFANQLINSDKEAREHQLVIDFIQQQLSKLNICAKLDEPRLLRLPNIQHRHTPISAAMPENGHILDVVGSLHPTPAVAGLPREIACQHIPHYEDFDRGLYAAPIGWIDTQGNGEFAVGIRSALLKGNTARLFAGAGIVAGSDPEKELNEVQLKLQALLKALV